MKKNEGNQVEVDEVLRVYFEAEEMLMRKIEESNNRMIILRNEREEITKRLDEAEKAERFSQPGLLKESELQLHLICVENLGKKRGKVELDTYYLLIEMGESTYQTKPQMLEENGKIIFEEECSL